jgi:predicted secreted protein
MDAYLKDRAIFPINITKEIVMPEKGTNTWLTPETGKKKIGLLFVLFFCASILWAGDTASFVDLGFSPDGTIYMFAQYGVQSKTLRPWADLCVVDVTRNNFVNGGKISYIHDGPVLAGQDGSGALYRIITRNTALAERHSVDHLRQGQPLYISLDSGNTRGEETIEFRDFHKNASYKARLVPMIEGSGDSLMSSFSITVERTAWDGAKKTYTVGSPDMRRSLVKAYHIKKVVVAPEDGSLIFVIAMQKQGADGMDIRYMVEAVHL